MICLSAHKESISCSEFEKEHQNQTELLDTTEHEMLPKEKHKLNGYREQPAEFALLNGLLLSNEYYNIGANNTSFKIGTYSYSGQTITLTSSDFKTLASKYNKIHLKSVTDLWLTDYAIDCTAFSVLADFENIYYIDTISSSLILNDNMKVTNNSKFLPLVKSLDGIDIILLPYNVFESHWVLVVLQLKENKIYILNPGEMMPPEEEIFKKIKKYFITRDQQNKFEKLNARKWKLDQIPSYPKQSDSYNCGVYVIYYIMTLSLYPNINDSFISSRNKEVSDHFDPEAFRITIQNILLISSKNVFHVCLVCGLNTTQTYIECTICKRWIHYLKCSGLQEKDTPLELVAAEDFNYICQLCQHLEDPFKYIKNDQQIKLNITELEYLVKHYKELLVNIYKNQMLSQESFKYNTTKDALKNSKWDYFVTYIDIETATKVARIIIKYTLISDKMFVCFVLLGVFFTKVIKRYYGLSENGHVGIYEKYKQIYGINEHDFEYPTPYTLDEIYFKLEEN